MLYTCKFNHTKVKQDATEVQGALTDIKEGRILGIEFDAEGKISKIMVLNAASASEMGEKE